DFIDALAMLIDDFPNLYGVCIGGAWNGATKYERKIVDYGKKRCGERLRFLGTRKDVFDLYGDMDIAVHPSHSENLGGAAESMLLEVPTIATDVGGFPDLVKHEETGLLVPPKNPNALAEAIRSMLQGKYELDTFKKKAKALALKLVDVKVNAQDVLEMYSSILAKKSL
ncbi:MAG: glycosyltransferase family 4 protein, partial [Clostridia bacterium]